MKVLSLALLVLGTAFPALAASPENPGGRTIVRKRVTCDSVSSFDPYVSIRGSIAIDTSSGAQRNTRGSFRISLSGGRALRADLAGDYVENGRMQFVTFDQDGVAGIREVYMDFGGNGFGRESYLEFENGDFYKMSCRLG